MASIDLFTIVRENVMEGSPFDIEMRGNSEKDKVFIPRGGSVDIQWKTTDANNVRLEIQMGNANLSKKIENTGHLQIYPLGYTIFFIEADGIKSDKISVFVIANAKSTINPNIPITITPILPVEAPGIGYFKAYPDTITEGKSTILRWEILRADKVVLRAATDPTVEGAVMTGSAYEVAPLIDTTYYLTASNAGGDTTARVDIKVIQKEKVKSPTVVSFVADKTILSSGEKVIEQNLIDMVTPTIAEDSKNIQGSENTYYWWILLIPVAWWMLGNKGGKS